MRERDCHASADLCASLSRFRGLSALWCRDSDTQHVTLQSDSTVVHGPDQRPRVGDIHSTCLPFCVRAFSQSLLDEVIPALPALSRLEKFYGTLVERAILKAVAMQPLKT